MLLLLTGDISISGGTFQGGNATGSGGTAGRGLSIDSYSSPTSFSISGGTFQAGAAPENATVNPAASIGGVGTITGGTFVGEPLTTGYGVSLLVPNWGGRTVLNISGGLFSGPMQFDLQYNSTVSFFGNDLSFDRGTGFLTGTLMDGNQLDVHIDLTGNSDVMYNFTPNGEQLIFGVPETSSIVTLGLGVLGVGLLFTARRIRQSKAPRLGTAQVKPELR